MNKVISLVTYREAITYMSRTEALDGSILNSQEDFEVHLKNIEVSKTYNKEEEPKLLG